MLWNGVVVPCRDEEVKVKAKALAAVQLAIALWSLREQGLVRLQPFEKQRRLRGRAPRLRAELVRHVEVPGLEGRILDRLRDKPTIGDVRAIYGKDITADGPLDIVNACREEAVAQGLLEYDTFFHDHATGDCERIRALEQPFAEAWRRWEAFRRAEPALAARLEEECRHGLPSRDRS